MRKTVYRQYLGTLLVLCGASVAVADEVTATGTIMATDPTTRSISVSRKTASGQKTGMFKVSQDAKIVINGTPADFRLLTANQMVTLTYDTSRRVITEIHVAGKMAKHDKTGATGQDAGRGNTGTSLGQSERTFTYKDDATDHPAVLCSISQRLGKH